uniref:Uncharacterized protein n=1 Tax=uncultured prokaryote TaxID=198431 RepID=A0A0H5Q430_9ZZZZ|nr:hypothetical protein [uncultured prokaryote]
MVSIREITVRWIAAGSPGGTSVLHFLDSGAIATQREELNDALTGLLAQLSSSTQYAIAEEGREFDVATGTLTGSWAESTPRSGTGTRPNAPVPNASQALLRLTTSTIIDGRILKGRMFIPGVSYEAVTGGELTFGAQGAIASAFDDLVTAGELVVWSRPRSARPDATPPVTARAGSAASVISTSAWSELAVLRRRR